MKNDKRGTENSTAWSRLSNRTLTVEQSRAVDRLAIEAYGMHSLVLMENAALGCVEWLQHRCVTPQITSILCGPGNNGGDGLAIARQLTVRGWPCQIILLGPTAKLSNDARANLRILTAGEGGIAIDILDGALPTAARARMRRSTVVIDALLGTGGGGAPRAPLDDWLREANKCQTLRVAIDVPTGVDATTGEAASGHFHANSTLTFVAQKPAMALPHAEQIFGQVHVLPIGIPVQMMHEILNKW